jgi:hypothetical protein
MAPQPKKPTYKEALESGLQPLSKFFKPKRGRGKPKKKGNLASDKISVQEVKRGRGRPLTTKNVTTKNVPGRVRPLTTKNVTTKNVPAPAVEPAKTAKASPPKKSKQIRTDWSKGEHLLKMQSALSEWDEKSDRYFDSNGEARSMPVFSLKVGIPYACYDWARPRHAIQ